VSRNASALSRARTAGPRRASDRWCTGLGASTRLHPGLQPRHDARGRRRIQTAERGPHLLLDQRKPANIGRTGRTPAREPADHRRAERCSTGRCQCSVQRSAARPAEDRPDGLTKDPLRFNV
jgi:hypothetical protein